MKLSLIFELLLIFILLAFAASKSVGKVKNNGKKVIQTRNDAVTAVEQVEDNTINKYCKCVEAYCNCCRDFKLPVVELNGPGCASLMYLNGDKMSVSLSFGKKVITNRTLSSRKPSPVCMPLPGGISKFCGRVYNIARAGEEFRACLGLELQSKSTVEAAVRVSCFKFGPRGVTSEPADPLPLVPQDEKAEDDDEDEYDEEDDFGLGGDEDDDDDDDDDDDGAIDSVNDVDGGDYTGFSLLGEDFLGDLFGGSSGGKKPNKNKKKQAPTSSTTTTTTTKRPRTQRPRPSRKPSSRSTTPRPVRTTTVRSRPTSGNRRPTRRPSRRPTRKPTTSLTSTSLLTSTMAQTTPVASSAFIPSQTTERNVISTSVEQTFEPIIAVRPAATTPKTATNFEDPGLEMSLAQLTGQLSALPVTPLISNEGKESSIKETEQLNYEKVQTITPRAPSTIAFSSDDDMINDEMIQIEQSPEENSPETESLTGDESQTQEYSYPSTIPDNYEEISIPKKKGRSQFNLADLDVLDLTKIGESVGNELGIFGKKRNNRDKNQDNKVKGEKEQSNEYDEIIDTLGDTLMMRKSDSNNNNKRDRRRQNKMMRGEWS